jgi:hypothetical protein
LFRDAAVLLVAAGVLIAVRLHAFDLPLETDECNYAYIGARLLAGDRLYVDVWDHQPPGIFALFAVVIALFGDAPEVFRWTAVAASLGTMGLIFAIVRRAAGHLAAYLAAGVFALCSADPGMAGEGCNREIFMNPFALAALWLLLRRPGPGQRDALIAGLLLGIGSTIKTVMAAQWLLMLGWLVVRTWLASKPGRRLRPLARIAVAFGAGPALVWTVTLSYFGATGRFDEIYEAVFAFNLGYSDVSASYWQRFADFFLAPIHRYVFSGTWPLWIAAGLSAAALPLIRRGRGFAVEAALLCYLVGTYWAVCLPGQFWPHYYYLMLPPLVIVLTVALGHLAALRPESGFARPGRWLAWCCAAVAALSLLVQQAEDYLLVAPAQITDERYDSRDLWGRAQGQNVALVTEPDDTVLVYGHDVGVYYYSGRRCASRFTMVRALGEAYPGFEKRRAILLEEVKASRPRLLLMVDVAFPALYDYIMANYQTVPRGIDYHDRRPNEPVMYVLADKERPIADIDWNWHRSSVRE